MGGLALTEQNGTKFVWSGVREKAAILLAENTLTDAEICEALGIGRTTLFRWQQHDEFKARVQENVAEIRASALRFPIAKKHYRVGVVDMLHTKALTVIEERAAEYAKAGEDEALAAVRKTFGEDVPAGGGTGLVVKTYKQIGSGRNATLVTEYGVDTALMREITNLHARAAKELGQEDEGAPAKALEVRLYVGVDVELV